MSALFLVLIVLCHLLGLINCVQNYALKRSVQTNAQNTSKFGLHSIDHNTLKWCVNITKHYPMSEITMLNLLPHELQIQYDAFRCHYVATKSRLMRLPLSICPSNNYNTNTKAPLIAVLVGSTTRQINQRVVQNIPLFIYMLPSLIRTLDCGYRYEVVLGYDVGDAFYDNSRGRNRTMRWWHNNVGKTMTANNIDISLRFVVVNNTIRKPGPVFNEIARTAYQIGADYFFRVNDDTEFTVNWASRFISGLNTLFPVGVGVVGPYCAVNAGILTHDFVSRLHMEIFNGVYYPPELPDWYMDDWISQVYGVSRTFQFDSVPIVHNFGKQSYEPDWSRRSLLGPLVASGKQKIKEWMSRKGESTKRILSFEADPPGLFKLSNVDDLRYSRPDNQMVNLNKFREEEQQQNDEYIKQIAALPVSREKRVIVLSMWTPHPSSQGARFSHGAIRNAELAAVYFPGWVCRFYAPSTVSSEVVSKLKSLGGEVYRIPDASDFESMFWKYTVADDATVDRYIIRDANYRLSARDRFAVEEWIQSGLPFHFIRDNFGLCYKVNGGTWGAVKGALTDMSGKIKRWARTQPTDYQAFLGNEIWPADNTTQMAHDAYCCHWYPGTRPFPTRRNMYLHFVGQSFDEKGQFNQEFIDLTTRKYTSPLKCRKHAEWLHG